MNISTLVGAGVIGRRTLVTADVSDPSRVLSPVPGQVIRADKFPRVSALPGTVVNGMSYLLSSASRNVVELNGPDTLTMPSLFGYDYRRLRFCFSVCDVIAGSSNYALIAFAKGYGTAYNAVAIYMYPDGTLAGGFYKKGEVADYASTNSVNVSDGFYHLVDMCASESGYLLRIDGVDGTFVEWEGIPSDYYDDIDPIKIIDSSAIVRPLRICNIVQSVNGQVIDTIPCDDGTGVTTLRNLTTPSRTATLSDSTAWASTIAPILPELQTEYLGVGGSWVAQSGKTKGLWKYRMIGRIDNNSSTGLVDRVLATKSVNWNDDFSVFIQLRRRVGDTVSYGCIFGSTTDGIGAATTARGLWIERDNLTNLYSILIYTSTGSLIVSFKVYIPEDVLSLTMVRVGTLFTVLTNGAIAWTQTVNAGIANTTIDIAVGSCKSGRSSNVNLMHFVLKNGTDTTYRFEETTGTTILDLTGTVNATLLDGSPATFHSLDWFPLP